MSDSLVFQYIGGKVADFDLDGSQRLSTGVYGREI